MQDQKQNKAQWQERPAAPIATRLMTYAEIEEFRNGLAASYKCGPESITYDFKRIKDINDSDRDDCFWLRYFMSYTVEQQLVKRKIFKMKIPVPENIKTRASTHTQQARRANTRRRPTRNVKLLEAAPELTSPPRRAPELRKHVKK
jgi:hypothetical protein